MTPLRQRILDVVGEDAPEVADKVIETALLPWVKGYVDELSKVWQRHADEQADAGNMFMYAKCLGSLLNEKNTIDALVGAIEEGK